MSEGPDLSKAIETVQQMLADENSENILGNLLSSLSDSSDNTQPAEENSGLDLSSLLSAFGGGDSNDEMPFDLGTVMKLQSVMSEMNRRKNDNGPTFLKALKPLLKKERRDKVDQAVKILGVTKALKIFKNLDNGRSD
ncbi:MAG: hypothetical protein E7401_01875 [Ruminococcaceae bacterium]|nr:hypothetical protein [Oscillospiraceae bacterium]